MTKHATSVGSGIVARTERIPIHERAEAVVIAWMWYQTNAYDQMAIKRIKGKHRETKRLLAEASWRLLESIAEGSRFQPPIACCNGRWPPLLGTREAGIDLNRYNSLVHS